jgi:hypothetical protein
VTEPKKQDGTMELDIGQIDLLDLPLPPSSARNLEEPRVSKGPPPLPRSMPPEHATEDASAEASSSDDAATRAFAAEAAFNPIPPPDPPRTPVSARMLVAEKAPEKNAAMRFLLGVGGASLLCAALFVGYRVLHKAPAAPLSSAQASATPSAVPVPTHAFTMAPIEFTSSPDDSASASSSASASTAPSVSAHTHATSGSSTSTPHATGTSTPKRTDEVIKVEN